MKVNVCAVIAALCVLAHAAVATDIVTTKGKIYRDAEIKAVDPDGLRILHRDGAAFIPFDDLPAATQARYGWTPERAAEVQAEKAAAAAQAEQMRIAAEKAAQERRRQAEAEAQAQAARDAQAREEQAAQTAAQQATTDHDKNATETAQRERRNRALAILGFIYFLPSIIGFRKRNAFAIIAFNVFVGLPALGLVTARLYAGSLAIPHISQALLLLAVPVFALTGLGWMIAFIWACMRDAPPPVAQHTTTTTTNYYTVVQEAADPGNPGAPYVPGKPVRGRVLPASDDPSLPPPENPRLPPRR